MCIRDRFPNSRLIALDPTVCQLLCSELKIRRRQGLCPERVYRGESDVSIKQTITTGDGHRFNGCVNSIKVRGSTKSAQRIPGRSRMGSPVGELKLRCKGYSHETDRRRVLCAGQ